LGEVRRGLDEIKKVLDTIGENTECMPDMRDNGVFCVNRERDKIYQVTEDGTSVSKMRVSPPESYDYERNGIKIKEIDENCRISTTENVTLLMCYKDNEDPKFLDIGSNLASMDKKLDDVLKGI